MKIAYDGKRFFQNSSGLGNYSRDLVRILSQYYPDNHYYLLNKKKTERGASILENKNVEYLPTSKGNMSRQFKMGKDAQNMGASIFHGLSGELPLSWNATPIKKVVTIHDLIFERFPEYYSFFDRKIHRWKFKKAAEKADRIIAISEQTKQDIVRYLKIPESKIQVVYQGCHESFKKKFSDDDLQSLAKKYNLPDEFLLNVGTVEKRKNVLNVIKSLKNQNQIPLIVVGRKTDYAKVLEKEAKKQKVDLRFLTVDSMEDLAGIYQLAKVFIYPSFFEGFGIPVIEALFSGTPVITSNISSLPEAGGHSAMYIVPSNVDDIAAKISFLWNNDSERERRSEIGLEFVKKFDDSEIAKNLMKVYLSI